MFKAIGKNLKSRFSMTFVRTSDCGIDENVCVYEDCYGDYWLATGIFGTRVRKNK